MAKKNNNPKIPTKLDEVLGKIRGTKEEDVKLHFITRILKDGVGKRDKTLDKYIFKVYQVMWMMKSMRRQMRWQTK